MIKLATIGVGNFGCVHLVQNELTGKYFAIKVMNKSDIVRGKQVEHVFNERDVLILVKSHPFMIEIYATYIDHRNLYLCIDYCPGGDMFRLIRENGKFEAPVAAFYGAEVVSCLDYLHSRGYAYRDLKPENILIAADGHIKLCDFGFAKYIDDRTWTLCGTPEYLAPEVLLGEGHGPAVDWWSFGVLLFEMMAGFPPFSGSKPIDIYDKILDGIYALPPFFTTCAKDIIRKFLVKAPAMRLGNLVGGREEVKRHPFFMSINWEMLEKKEVAPPIVPKITGEGDVGYVDFLPGDRDLSKFELFDPSIAARGRVPIDPYVATFRSWATGTY